MRHMNVIVISFFVLATPYCVVQAGLYLNAESSTVSQGTLTQLNCYNSDLDDMNIYNTGGKIEWCRNTQYSSSMQVLVQWTRVTGDLIVVDDLRFTIEGGLVSPTQLNQYLKIRNTSKTDQGTYFCILYNGQGDEVVRSLSLSLTVRYPPAEYYPLCTATPIGNGDDINLLCQSEKTEPPVSVQWFRENTKVADGRNNAHQTYTQSQYQLSPNERANRFECRMVYDDDTGIEVRRSCQFSQPYVAILRMGGEQTSVPDEYHVFAHSSPPFVSDINCTLELSTATRVEYEQRFPGYGVATVGPLATADNGTHLVCRAENILGTGEARMVVYSSDGSRGDTTLPSVVTNYNYMNSEGALISASIFPTQPLVPVGENVTFGCSTNFTTTIPFSRARVDISWKYNDEPIPSLNSRFIRKGNVLHMSNVSKADNNAFVTCVAAVVETTMIPGPSSESNAIIKVTTKSESRCVASEIADVLSQTQVQNQSLLQQSSFVIGMSILAVIGWLALIVILIFVLLRNRKQNRSEYNDTKMNPPMTYRAGTNTLINGQSRNVDDTANPAQRALPAHPDPSMNEMSNNTMEKQKHDLHVIIPNGGPITEMAYQEMVGDTGINKSRHGSIASNITMRVGQTPNGSLSSPGIMVPGPQGGFLPRSLSNGHTLANHGQRGDGEFSYEDLDTIQQRRRLRRATSNDYQTTIDNTLWQKDQQEQLLPHYANS